MTLIAPRVAAPLLAEDAQKLRYALNGSDEDAGYNKALVEKKLEELKKQQQKQDDKKDDKGDKDKDKKEGKDDQKKDDPSKDKGEPKPTPGGISKERVQNLLDAVNNEEKKIQDKVKAQKVKGTPRKTEKDW